MPKWWSFQRKNDFCQTCASWCSNIKHMFFCHTNPTANHQKHESTRTGRWVWYGWRYVDHPDNRNLFQSKHCNIGKQKLKTWNFICIPSISIILVCSNYSIFQELRPLDSPRQLPNFLFWEISSNSPIMAPMISRPKITHRIPAPSNVVPAVWAEKVEKSDPRGERRETHIGSPAFLWFLFLPRIIVNKARRKVPNLNLRFKQKNTCLHAKKKTHTQKKERVLYGSILNRPPAI